MKTFSFVGVVILRFIHVCLQSQDSSVDIAASLATEKSIRFPKGQDIFFLASSFDIWPTHTCI
jgi:hypothetical protein